MKRKRFKKEQIIGILKEAEAGVAAQDPWCPETDRWNSCTESRRCAA
jgi:hypothetical protein